MRGRKSRFGRIGGGGGREMRGEGTTSRKENESETRNYQGKVREGERENGRVVKRGRRGEKEVKKAKKVEKAEGSGKGKLGYGRGRESRVGGERVEEAGKEGEGEGGDGGGLGVSYDSRGNGKGH